MYVTSGQQKPLVKQRVELVLMLLLCLISVGIVSL